MKIRTFGRHIRESLKSLVRNGWMTFASVSAVTVTLLLVGVFFVILMNLNEMANSLEKDVQIKVFAETTATEEQLDTLESQLKSIREVESVNFSSKDNELKSLAESMGEDGKVFVELFQESNPLSDVFIVKAKDPLDTMKVAKKIENFDYVEDVRYGKGVVEKLFNVLEVSRNVGIVLIAGLFFTATFLISNTIKITIVARRREIEIMRLVGATNGFIRWPFFLEGIWLGILGSIIPIVLITTVYDEFYNTLAPRLESSFIQILETTPFAYQVSGMLLLLGCLIGAWGSLMSVRKFLKV